MKYKAVEDFTEDEIVTALLNALGKKSKIGLSVDGYYLTNNILQATVILIMQQRKEIGKQKEAIKLYRQIAHKEKDSHTFVKDEIQIFAERIAKQLKDWQEDNIFKRKRYESNNIDEVYKIDNENVVLEMVIDIVGDIYKEMVGKYDG